MAESTDPTMRANVPAHLTPAGTTHPAPAQIEAVAKVLSDMGSPWTRGDRLIVAEAALTAAAQVERECECETARRTGTCGRIEWLREQHPAPEADEREDRDALIVAWCSWDLNDAEACADAILADGFRRSQPAPRTVSRVWLHDTWRDSQKDETPHPGLSWEDARAARFLAALGITVEAPRD